MNDLLIRHALVFDGTGGEPQVQDVAVHQGRFTQIARDIAPDAARVIDADGLALMPGIIDSPTHFGAQITWDATLRPSLALGVTTAVIGNCSFTIAPCRPEHRGITMRYLTQVEGTSLDVLQRGIRWEFKTYPEYLAQRQRHPAVLNVAAYVGHSPIRTWVMARPPPSARPPPTKPMRRSSSCAKRCKPARSAWPAARARRITAKAESRCRLAWPATSSISRSCARWASKVAASTWSPRAGRGSSFCAQVTGRRQQ